MWAYGCHYHCDAKNGPTYAMFDSDFASIYIHMMNTVLDIGVLKAI
jgi:hypothetical protein